jgi:hypothetical protein
MEITLQDAIADDRSEWVCFFAPCVHLDLKGGNVCKFWYLKLLGNYQISKIQILKF